MKVIQKKRILEYLENHKGITAKEAQDILGIARLASRISDLKDDGYTISTEWEEGENRFHEPTRYKRYYLCKNNT